METRAFIRYQNFGESTAPQFAADAIWLVSKDGVDFMAVDRDAEVRSSAQLDELDTINPDLAEYILDNLSNGVSCVFSEIPVGLDDTTTSMFDKYISNGLAGQLS